MSSKNKQTINGNKHVFNILRSIEESDEAKTKEGYSIKFTTLSAAASHSDCSPSNECFREAFRLVVEKKLCTEIRKEDSNSFKDLFPPKSNHANLLKSCSSIFIITKKGEEILSKWYELNSIYIN